MLDLNTIDNQNQTDGFFSSISDVPALKELSYSGEVGKEHQLICI